MPVAAAVEEAEPDAGVEPAVGVVHRREGVVALPLREEVLRVGVVRARHLQEVGGGATQVRLRRRRDAHLGQRLGGERQIALDARTGHGELVHATPAARRLIVFGSEIKILNESYYI